jgi:hypothetical protein
MHALQLIIQKVGGRPYVSQNVLPKEKDEISIGIHIPFLTIPSAVFGDDAHPIFSLTPLPSPDMSGTTKRRKKEED